MSDRMIEAHFFGLPSQSNIYGLTSLSSAGGINKVLVASLNRKVYCVEYTKNYKELIPSTREVQFTYIPSGAEIISIDAFNQACHEHDFVVGITFIKGDSVGSHSQYFNIYSDWEPGNECDLDNIAQSCLSLGLDFIPYQLTHTEMILDKCSEIVWLLSGSDCKVHLYREDKSHQSFCEEPSADYFPEFENLLSIVHWMDFKYVHNARLTAVGCENGFVGISLVEVSPVIRLKSSWSLQHDGPISVVSFFSDFSTHPSPDFMPFPADMCEIQQDSTIHLMVGNMLEPCVVYRDILKHGLNNQWIFPDSEKFDCATAACVADINMDGLNEILIGTYGKELLLYKWQGDSLDCGGYKLQWKKPFSHPVLTLAYIDITGDGVKELLVLSTKGLHILQHDQEKIVQKIIQRLKIAKEHMKGSHSLFK